MPGPSSILYVNPTRQLRAGIETLSGHFASESEVTVLTPAETGARLAEREDVEYVYFDANYVPSVRYTLPSRSFLRELDRLVARADVVHTYSYIYPVCAIATLVAARRDAASVVTVDAFPGVNWRSGNRPVDAIGRLYTETAGRATFAAADAVVGLGEYLARPLDRYVRRGDVEVIPNGIDVERFAPRRTPFDRPTRDERTGSDERSTSDDQSASDDRSAFDTRTAPDERSLLFVGRLDPVKGIPYALEALAILTRAAERPYRLTVVGDGTNRREYARLSRDLGIADRVSFVGYRSRLVPYYREHDLFVLPSLSEGQPTVLLEAQSCGLPVVATDVGGVAELVAAGAVVPPEDPRALAEAITAVETDDERRAAARAHVVERYSGERMGERYRALYARLTAP